MVFVSSPRAILSPQQSLELANVYLENANKAANPNISLVLCHDTELSLSQAKKSAKRDDDSAVNAGVAIAYIELGRILSSRGHCNEAKASYRKAEKLGVRLQEDRLAQTLEPVASLTQHKGSRDIAVILSHIFAENVRPHAFVSKLPEPDERLHDTPQLACCLSLLKASHSLDDILEPAARNWIQTVEKDDDEQERLKVLATDVIRAYKRDEIKDAKTVAEI
ncbi:hypothetical protein BGZ65_006678, partial [Modicella reniformis]